MDVLSEHAREAFKRGEYEKAIKYLGRAIDRVPSVRLLDSRAACHEKRGDLSAALVDAKSAIRLSRDDATGYLRAGSILLKMQKRDLALEFYTRALRSIKPVGKGYERLQAAEQRLRLRASRGARHVDLFAVLPPELVEVVLEHLSFRQRMNACLVSKHWAQHIRSYPRLWKHLDFSNARRKVPNAFISRCINVARKHVKAATLGDLYDSEKTLRALVKHCPLQDLTLLTYDSPTATLCNALREAKALKCLKTARDIILRAEDLQLLLRYCSATLCTLQCTVSQRLYALDALCGSLTTLHLVYVQGRATSLFWNSIAKRMPALESLTLHNVTPEIHGHLDEPLDLRSCHRLSHLNLRLKLPHAHALMLPPNLISIALQAVAPLSTDFWLSNSDSLVPFYLPQLEELVLNDTPYSVHDAVEALLAPKDNVRSRSPSAIISCLHNQLISHETHELSGASMLKALSIVGVVRHSRQHLAFLANPRLRSLEVLSLPGEHDLDDEIVQDIVAQLPNLRSIDLSGSSITGVGVRSLVRSGCIREIAIHHCRSIGPDAVEWARSRGLRVHYNMSESSTGARKMIWF